MLHRQTLRVTDTRHYPLRETGVFVSDVDRTRSDLRLHDKDPCDLVIFDCRSVSHSEFRSKQRDKIFEDNIE